ncbi:EAL domain-containing protein [Glutamicibacter sp.]|uniref:EAL domain-containing protein n=1 Tax=Glutamicibacter sp. TaxID=1931995 RepID=UPI002B46D9BB|nr:EAL domain-containing protein [Glutamicibacter sp.]HJX76727.1 EAL domain-containing protein [Glutamicibacter sp.]
MHFVFQPLIDVDQWTVFGFEALTRFDDEVSPDVHFRNAYTENRLTELELQVIDGIIQASVHLPSGMLLTLNASGPTIEALGAATVEMDARLTWGLELNELSEPCLCNQARNIATSLNCLLLIDDAGIGYANRSRILELEPDVVKLDRSMISSYAESAEVRKLVDSLLSAARETGAKTLAEGLETAEDLELIRHLAIDYAQGFYFAAGNRTEQLPMILDDLHRRLGINVPSF